MDLYHYHSKPQELIFQDSDKIDKIPAVAWNKYSFIGELQRHSATFAKDAKYALKYADNFDIEFPEGEEAIATSHEYSYDYAKFVLRGRFEQGEEAIATDAYYSYYYARDIMHGAFPEGEKVMKANTDVWKLYNKRLKEKEK